MSKKKFSSTTDYMTAPVGTVVRLNSTGVKLLKSAEHGGWVRLGHRDRPLPFHPVLSNAEISRVKSVVVMKNG